MDKNRARAMKVTDGFFDLAISSLPDSAADAPNVAAIEDRIYEFIGDGPAKDLISEAVFLASFSIYRYNLLIQSICEKHSLDPAIVIRLEAEQQRFDNLKNSFND